MYQWTILPISDEFAESAALLRRHHAGPSLLRFDVHPHSYCFQTDKRLSVTSSDSNVQVKVCYA